MSAKELKNKKALLNSPLAKGVLVAMLLTFIFIFLLTILFQFTKLTEKYLEVIVLFILIFSITGGGIQAAKKAEARFLLHGLGVGLIYLTGLIIVSYFTASTIIFVTFIEKLLYCSVSGIAGGLIGAIIR